MKKLLMIISAGLSMILSSCATNYNFDILQSQIDRLKSGQIATIENQISSITGSISAIQNMD